MLCLKSLTVSFSFTPGFSPVIKDPEIHRNRFNGFSVSFTRQNRLSVLRKVNR